MIDLGTVRPGSTVRIPFSSFDKDDSSSITMTNFAVGDILVYKDGNTTARASTSGFTATTDFSSKTGKHLAIIDLADNTTAGFWNAGSEYLVAIDAVTIDGVTTGGWIARFRIGYAGALLDTTIATLSSQTSFTLTSGPAEDDALNGRAVILHDLANAVQVAQAIVSDYTGSTKTVTLTAAPTFTIAAGDNISIMQPQPVQSSEIVSQVNDAQADIFLLRVLLQGLVVAGDGFTVVIGSTGNDTTHVHLPGLTYGNDELNGLLLVIKDVSTGELHSRWIEDWSDTGDLATVATLPFTPENAVDIYWVLSTRDVVKDRITFDATGILPNVNVSAWNEKAATDDGDLPLVDVFAVGGVQWDQIEVLRIGIAQGGGDSSITLDASAWSDDNIPVGAIIALIGTGTGQGQVRMITEYNGSTKVATIEPPWTVIPDNTTGFRINPFNQPWDALAANHRRVGTFGQGSQVLRTGAVASATGTTIVLDAGASGINDEYIGLLVLIMSGTGRGQFRYISDYVGATKTATVDTWGTNPDSTSRYVLIGF